MPRKGGEVQVDIDRDAVIGAAAPYPQPDSGELGALHVDPGGTRAPGGGHAPVRDHVDHRLLEVVDEPAHPEPEPTKIEQDVGDRLAGVRDRLPAPRGPSQ